MCRTPIQPTIKQLAMTAARLFQACYAHAATANRLRECPSNLLLTKTHDPLSHDAQSSSPTIQSKPIKVTCRWRTEPISWLYQSPHSLPSLPWRSKWHTSGLPMTHPASAKAPQQHQHPVPQSRRSNTLHLPQTLRAFLSAHASSQMHGTALQTPGSKPVAYEAANSSRDQQQPGSHTTAASILEQSVTCHAS